MYLSVVECSGNFSGFDFIEENSFEFRSHSTCHTRWKFNFQHSIGSITNTTWTTFHARRFHSNENDEIGSSTHIALLHVWRRKEWRGNLLLAIIFTIFIGSYQSIVDYHSCRTRSIESKNWIHSCFIPFVICNEIHWFRWIYSLLRSSSKGSSEYNDVRHGDWSIVRGDLLSCCRYLEKHISMNLQTYFKENETDDENRTTNNHPPIYVLSCVKDPSLSTIGKVFSLLDSPVHSHHGTIRLFLECKRTNEFFFEIIFSSF